MDSNVQPSFIPKKSLAQPTPGRQKQHVSLFSLIATIVFITMLVLAGVVWGAEFYFNKQIDTKKQALQTELNKFQGALVGELSRLDSRFTVAKSLFDKHLSLSEFFSVLGKTTLKSVRFSSFSFDTAGPKPSVAMDGQALNFASVALQKDQFNLPENRKYFSDISVGSPNLDGKGNVSFLFTASIDPQQFSYSNLFKSKGITIQSSTTPATITASSTATTTASQTGSTTTATTTKKR